MRIAGAWRWNQKKRTGFGEGGWGLCRCLEGGLLKGECELGAADTALCCPRWVRGLRSGGQELCGTRRRGGAGREWMWQRGFWTTPQSHFSEKGERSTIVGRGSRAARALKDPRDLYFCEAEWREPVDKGRLKNCERFSNACPL